MSARRPKSAPAAPNRRRPALRQKAVVRPSRPVRRVPRQARSDISMSAPVGSAAQQHMLPPKINRSARGMRVAHREFVATVVNTNGSFGATKFSVNPGIAATFPWLSVQAADWDQYTMHRCKFIYITRSATSEVGSVILSPDYDAADVSPTTEAQMTAYQDTVEDAPWKDQVCVLDPQAMHPSGPRKFLRTGRPYGDIKTYDVANLFVGTNGASTNNIGKLWVEYDCEFFVPQLGAAQASGPEGTSLFARAASQTFTTATPAAQDFDAPTFDPLGIGADAAGVFTPPAGSYLVNYNAAFTDSANEIMVVLIQLQKNGVTLAGGTEQVYSPSSASGPSAHVSASTVFTANGTDTFQVLVTLTGAAGTLTSRALTPSIWFSAA